MQGTMTGKILEAHLVEGRLLPGEEVALRIDQTLLQDATGTMACMEFEALGLDEVKVDLAVQYVDHNMLQFDHRNADDHLFLQTFAARHGIRFSRAGNGICHQVHTERFARPGATLLGADSHTPTSGACGSIAIGAGGLEVALAMAGQPFRMPIPVVVGVHLDGELPPWVASKDLILWLIRKYTVKGGLNRIFEFTGPGAANLPVTRRATVCNMITELGGTTAIFPSDEQTHRYLHRQRREDQWVQLGADPDAAYDEELHVDLSNLEPLIAKPSQPDNVVPVEQVAGTPVFQVCFGSSVNSWYEDLAISAAVSWTATTCPRPPSARSRPAAARSSRPSPARGSWRSWSGPAYGSWSRPAGRASASARHPRPARRACAPSTATSRAAPARSTTRSTSPPRRPRQPPACTAGSPIRGRSATRPRSTIQSRWSTTS
jgi:aconitate hydratase